MRPLSVCWLLLAVGICPFSPPSRAAEPDQVLVLYNADWSEDLPGTESGQDSLEVARYYRDRRSDPDTGRRPHLLGLSGVNGSLDGELLAESEENLWGVRYVGSGPPVSEGRLARQGWMLSNRVECFFPLEEYDTRSVRLLARPVGSEGPWRTVYGEEADVPAGSVSARSEPPGAKSSDPAGLRILFDAPRAGMHGDIEVRALARKTNGEQTDTTVRCFDPEDFAPADFAPDGRRYDRNYREQIAGAVRAFLEDPANAVDGRPLKDHVLYIVIAYGLPRTVSRVNGIGQTGEALSRVRPAPLVSLCQRLEMLYYDRQAARPQKLMPVRRRETVGPFRCWWPANSWCAPLIGREFRPWAHPAAYADYRRSPRLAPPWPRPPRWDVAYRARHAERFLYIVSRIDALDPRASKEMIDRAIYAERHLTDRLGRTPAGENAEDDDPGNTTGSLAAALERIGSAVGYAALEALGLPGRVRRNHYAGGFGLGPDGLYLPGAIDWEVISKNGMNSQSSHGRRSLRAGVTVTAAAARAYNGCAHTTTHAWWDARVFYDLLFRGYQLGEAWMYSRVYCEWVTSFFGDPLYCPDLRRTVADVSPPAVGEGDVAFTLGEGPESPFAVLDVTIPQPHGAPELARATADYWPVGEPQVIQAASSRRLLARPRLVFTGLDPGRRYRCRLVLEDPYGNRFDSEAAGLDLTFEVPGEDVEAPEAIELEQPETFWIGGDTRRDRISRSGGRVELTFVPGPGGFVIFRCGNLRLHCDAEDDTLRLKGLGADLVAEVKLETGREARIAFGYRQWPRTRAIWRIDEDGRWNLLASDPTSPWFAPELARNARFIQDEARGRVLRARLWPTCEPQGEEK